MKQQFTMIHNNLQERILHFLLLEENGSFEICILYVSSNISKKALLLKRFDTKFSQVTTINPK